MIIEIIPGISYIGRVSEFGGPNDEGVKKDEGLALFEKSQIALAPYLFLPNQPQGTTGLARRLNPEACYCAMRWNYDVTPKDVLRRAYVEISSVLNPSTWITAVPVDEGPGVMDRIIDVSPRVTKLLQLRTDDLVRVQLFLSDEDTRKN